MSDCPSTVMENLRAHLNLADGEAIPVGFFLSDDEKGNIDQDAVPFSVELRPNTLTYNSLPNDTSAKSIRLRSRINP